MKRFFKLLAVSAACLILTISAAPQALPVLYDSSITVPAPSASSTEIVRVYKELLHVGGTQLKNQCFDGKLPATPKLSGLARGAFTRKGAAQVAWLFELCYTKRHSENGFYGLVVLENGQTKCVSSIQLIDVYALATELYSLRDINLNGTDELALLWRSADGAGSMRVLSLLEQTDQKLASLGQLLVHEFYSAELGNGIENVDWKVYVVKSKLPVFIATPNSGKGSPVKLTLDKPSLELQTFLVR